MSEQITNQPNPETAIEKSRSEIALLSNADLSIFLQASIRSGRPELIALYANEAAKRLSKQ